MLPPVVVHVVASGVSDVLSALRTVQSAQERQEKASVDGKRRSLSSQRSLLEDFATSHGSIANRMISVTQRRLARQLSDERKYTDALDRENQKRAKGQERQAMQGRGAGGAPPSGGGGGLAGGEAGGAGGEMAGGLALSGEAIAATGGLALVAVAAVAAVLVVKKGLELLADGIKYGVNEFADAILEIGGGFKVSSALVMGARNEAAATQLATSMAGNIDPKRMEEMIARLSKGSFFTREQHTEAARAWAEKAGNLEGYEEMAGFNEKVARTTSVDLKETTELSAKLHTAAPKMSTKDLQNTILGIVGLGQQGPIEAKSFVAGEGAKLLTQASQLKGGLTSENVNKVTGAAEAIAGGTGMTPQTAVTATDALFKDIKNIATKRPEVLRGLGGTFEHGQVGKIDKILENLVVRDFHGQLGNIKGLNRRSKDAIAGLRTSAGVEATDTDQQIREKVAAVQKKFNQPQTMEQLDENMKKVSDTVENKVVTAFNELRNVVSDALMPALREVVNGPLMAFMKSLTDSKDQIANAGGVISGTLTVVAALFDAFKPGLELAAQALLYLGEATIGTARALMKISGVSAAMEFASPGSTAKVDKALEDLQKRFETASDWMHDPTHGGTVAPPGSFIGPPAPEKVTSPGVLKRPEAVVTEARPAVPPPVDILKMLYPGGVPTSTPLAPDPSAPTPTPAPSGAPATTGVKPFDGKQIGNDIGKAAADTINRLIMVPLPLPTGGDPMTHGPKR